MITAAQRTAIATIIAVAEFRISRETGYAVRLKAGKAIQLPERSNKIALLKTTIQQLTGISYRMIKSPCRTGEVCLARFAYCYFRYRVIRETSYPALGKELNRHHSTIIHDVSEFGNLLQSGDAKVVELHQKILKLLK